LELAHFLEQRARRQHDAVADEAGDAAVQDAGGNQAQHRLAAADDQRVAGVVPALEAHDARDAIGQQVDDLALAFVAPLGADDDHISVHGGGLYARTKYSRTMPALMLTRPHRRSCPSGRPVNIDMTRFMDRGLRNGRMPSRTRYSANAASRSDQ